MPTGRCQGIFELKQAGPHERLFVMIVWTIYTLMILLSCLILVFCGLWHVYYTTCMQDHDMSRGKPLYLSKERYAALTYLVSNMLWSFLWNYFGSEQPIEWIESLTLLFLLMFLVDIIWFAWFCITFNWLCSFYKLHKVASHGLDRSSEVLRQTTTNLNGLY